MRPLPLLLLLLVAALAFLLVPSCSAQVTNVTDMEATPIPGAGHDYNGMLNETVNPANGSLSVRINVPMPTGRKLTVPFAFAYDSNGATATSLPQGRIPYLFQHGWTYTAPVLNWQSGVIKGNAGDRGGACGFTSGYVFTDPQGTRHSFPTIIDGDNTVYCPDLGIITNTTGGDAWLSYTANGIQDADGTTYTGISGTDGLARTVEDRNGNVIHYNDTGNGVFTVTDTAGRTVLSSSGFGSTGNTVTVSGLANPYTLTWGTSVTPNANWGSSAMAYNPNSVSCEYEDPLEVTYAITLLSVLTLPNGQSYKFYYDPSYGLLNEIVYPSGGWVKYTWGANGQSQMAIGSGTDQNGPHPCFYRIGNPVVVERQVSYDGTNVAEEQDYTYGTTWREPAGTEGAQWWSYKNTTVVTKDDVRGQSFQTGYTYSPITIQAPAGMVFAIGTQVPVESSIAYYNTGGGLLKTVNKTWYNQYLLESEQTVWPNGQSSQVVYSYGSLGVVTEKDEYDYGASSPTRKTMTNYQSFPANPLGSYIYDRPCQTLVEDGNSNPTAETDILYDGGAAVCGTAGTPSVTVVSGLPTGTHDEANYGPSSSAPRGNATGIIKRCFQNGGSCPSGNPTISATFDETGQETSMTDPLGNTRQYSYADSYTSGTPPGTTNTYLTQVTYPAANGVAHIENFSYGYADGQLTQSKDENGQVTTYKYNTPPPGCSSPDGLDRLSEIDYPDGGVTTYCYNDSALTVTQSNLINSSGQYLTRTTFMDGMGHPIQTQLTSDPEGTDYTATAYDGLGRLYTASNPYRSTSDPTYGITTYTYDPLGRTIQATHPDGTSVQTSYTGRATEVTDEGNGTTSVQRISYSDGLGRLRSVCEVTASNLTVGIAGSTATSACGQDVQDTQDYAAQGFYTTYNYDTLDNLTSVSQGPLNPRTFAYDSLSRLTSSTNPEAGTIAYAYDADDNVVTKTDARGITTTNSYDALNRLTTKSYSDGTLSSSYFYDVLPSWWGGIGTSNAIGRLVAEGTGQNWPTASWFSYDAMGRITRDRQWVNGSAYPVSYAYDFLGDITSATNGVGVTFNYTDDGAAHLTALTSSLSDANHPGTLLSNVSYTPLGGMSSATLGNGVTEALSYTKRAWLQSLTATNPNDVVSQGAPGTGSATVTGSEQSSSGTPGTGTVAISGSEQSFQYCDSDGNCAPLEYDSGSVSVTVNGVTATADYGQSDDAGTVTASLASAINSTSGMPVNATVNSNGNITLTAKTTGTATNYSLSSSYFSSLQQDYPCSNYDPCPSASFYPSTSGSHLTGGTGGATIYDSGTVSVNVNGFQASASYGQSSTSSSLASAIAGAFNGNNSSPVSASASGGTIALTANTTGANTDYSLSSGSSTNQPSTFSQPSFAVSVSGPSLTGGANTVDQTVYSFSLVFAPNGDILTANDSVNGNWTYSYDDFNRLLAATASGQNQSYSYAYDRYGNRWQDNLNGACQAGTTSCLTFDANNHVNNGALSYDAAGNVTADGFHTYTYDAENRLTQVDGGATASYVYDADGRRVQKTAYGASTGYVYDLNGHYTAQLDGSGAWTLTEVYAGSRHLATYSGGPSGTTYFNHVDWLGTERARSDVNGNSHETCTSLPFGDGLNCAGGDLSPLHFTGKERDTESALDYFGVRYFASAMGRWGSPDEPFADQNPIEPQSWNLYGYVRNSPTNAIDLDGLLTIIIPGTSYNPADWGPDNPLVQDMEAIFHDQIQVLKWSGGDDRLARWWAARQVRQMVANHKFAPGEGVHIIGHSHGGNIALLASHGIARPIDDLITLGTPVRLDYTPDMANIGVWIQAYSTTDLVQIFGGFGVCSPVAECGPAGRTFPDALNIQVSTPGKGPVGSHTALWQSEAARNQWESLLQEMEFNFSDPSTTLGGDAGVIPAYRFWWQNFF